MGVDPEPGGGGDVQRVSSKVEENFSTPPKM